MVIGLSRVQLDLKSHEFDYPDYYDYRPNGTTRSLFINLSKTLQFPGQEE